MANKMTYELSDKLFAQLQNESLVLLHTIDSKHGHPTSSAISWIYAPDRTTLRFALDKRSQICENISRNASVTFSLFGDEKVHAVYGKARMASEAMEGVPFKMVCMEVTIDSIKDAMFYGSRMMVQPEFEKTYDQRAAEKLDNQVFSAMKKV